MFEKIKDVLFSGRFSAPEQAETHLPIENIYSDDAYTNGKIFLYIKYNLLPHSKTRDEQTAWQCLLDWWGNRQNYIFPDTKQKIKQYVIFKLQETELNTVTYKHLSIVWNELNRK